MKKTVAFLGTGIMGAPMCAHLIDGGLSVNVWNRTQDKLAHLVERGAQAFESPRKAVAGAEFTLIMLSSGDVVDQVLFDSDATGSTVAESMSGGSTVIVMSSIPVELSREQAARLEESGVSYVDAPVSGGQRGAEEATLTIMAGGGEPAVTRAIPILETMGRVTHVGPVGCGQLAKLANQTIVGITIGAVAEALLLANAGGADIAAVREALIDGFADSTILRHHGERMVERNFKPGARAEIQLKDMRTARELAESFGLDLPALKLAESLYREMCQHGRQDFDHSALYLEIADRGKAK